MATTKTGHNTYVKMSLDKVRTISSINILQSSMKRNKLD